MITTWLRRKLAAWLRAQASDIESGLPTRARSTWSDDAPAPQVAQSTAPNKPVPQQVPNPRPPQWHEFVGDHWSPLTAYHVPDEPKMLRETLCVAQTRIGDSLLDVERIIEHVDRLQRLIDACDAHRPLGPDGKH